ncbi:MAG: 50S ribosomal protein L20 [Planctomycetota bacterium]
MPRVRKGAARNQARKRLLRQARGYFGSNHKSPYRAKDAVIRAGTYAYRDRRQRKRDFRALWITRITAACKMRGTRYSRFMNGLKNANIIINRKMLSQIAIEDPKLFDRLVEEALKVSNATVKAGETAA